jgi:O-antigen/teichoic acid export membrane protein
MPILKRERRFLAAAGAGVLQRLVQIACTLILMPKLLTVLGVADFGIWGSASSLAWFSGLVDIGIGAALVTLVARSLAAGHADAARAQLAGALTVGTAIGLALLVCAVLLFAVTGASPTLHPYLIAIAGLALNTPLNSANNAWMALQKGYISGFWELVQTLLTLALALAAAPLTHDPRVYVAIMYGALVLANTGSLVHLFLAHPELRPRHLALTHSREVIAEGILLFGLNIGGGLSFLLDNVLALHLLGPEASARMTIALRICMTGLGFLLVASQPLWPAFVEAAHLQDRHWIRNTLLRGTASLVGVSLLGSVILINYGQRLVGLWLHSTLGFDQALLWAISSWVVVQAFVRVPILLLNGLSIIRFQVAAVTTATAIALTLKFILAPHLGVAGILWGTTTTVIIVVIPAFLWRVSTWYSNLHSNEYATPKGIE